MGKALLERSVRHCLAAMLVLTATAAAVADDVEGVVRISDMPDTASVVIRGQSPTVAQAGCRACETGNCPEHGVGAYSCPAPSGMCPPCGEGPRCVFGGNCLSSCLRRHSMMHRARTRMTSQALCCSFHESCEEKWQWFQCKFGYFIPTGCCGKGCPPHGCYSMVYPLDPNYFDGRDGQVYAAQGYAGPVSVPLAPVVNHTFNYGWGIPSARLTPVSHPIQGH